VPAGGKLANAARNRYSIGRIGAVVGLGLVGALSLVLAASAAMRGSG
jgi:hypothetical protein